MIKMYGQFITENVQRSKAILDEKLRQLDALKARLTRDNTLGYLGKLTDLLFKGATAEQITDAYERILALRRTNVRVDIDSAETIGELRRDIARTETVTRVRQVVAKLPPAQKRWFTGLNITEEDTEVLSKMALVDTVPFMRAVSQYRDKNTFLTMARRFVETANLPADARHFRGLAKGGLRIVHDDGRTIVFHTATARDLVKVAGDASWCIKREGNFRNYTEGGKMQFVLIDLERGRWDSLFKIGFTVSPTGAVTAAHDMTNDGCVPYVKELLAGRGISISSLLGRETDGGPDPVKDTLDRLVNWASENHLTPEQADQWIEALTNRKGVWRKLMNENWWDFLSKLLKTSARGAYVEDAKAEWLMTSIGMPRSYWPNFKRLLRNRGTTLPDTSAIEMQSLFSDGTPNARLLPHIHLVKHNIFKDDDVDTCVEWVIGLLGSRDARRACPDIADQVRRLISVMPARHGYQRAKREIILAAWRMAVSGESPDLDSISRLFEEYVDGEGDKILKEVAILCLLRVRHPFSEISVLGNFWVYLRNSGFDLIDFGSGVTLRLITHYLHEELFRMLVREGVRVTVEATDADVLKILRSRARWAKDGDGYESKTKAPLPAWLDSPAMRLLVVRKGEKGFDWAAGTKFPLTLKSQGKFEVVIKSKRGKS